MGAMIRGIYRDILMDGNQQIVHDSGWQSNTIVLSCRQLLATLMKGVRNSSAVGIAYLMVGAGAESWDSQDNVKASVEDIELTHAYLQDKILAGNLKIETLEPGTGLQITVELPPRVPTPKNDEPVPLREFGLFGQIITNDSGPTDYMINNVRHKVIYKTPDMTLKRVILLEF